MSNPVSKTTDRPSGCVAVWQPGEKPDPGTMHWLAPDGTRWPATDREQAENAALVRSMRLTAETRGGSYRPWSKWFAWRPVRASGRWRWLVWVERRRVDEERGIQTSYLPEEWPFEYRLPEQVS